MDDNPFAPPQADVATGRPPARPPVRSLLVLGVLVVAFFGFGGYGWARSGGGLWAITVAVVLAILFLALPFVLAGIVALVVWATRLGSRPHVVWDTVKVTSCVLSALIVLASVFLYGLTRISK